MFNGIICLGVFDDSCLAAIVFRATMMIEVLKVGSVIRGAQPDVIVVVVMMMMTMMMMMMIESASFCVCG